MRIGRESHLDLDPGAATEDSMGSDATCFTRFREDGKFPTMVRLWSEPFEDRRVERFVEGIERRSDRHHGAGFEVLSGPIPDRHLPAVAGIDARSLRRPGRLSSTPDQINDAPPQTR